MLRLMAMKPIIKLTGIAKGFPDGEGRQGRRGQSDGLRDGRPGWREVLRGVDLEVAAGEFVAVSGPSGSGKTTLLSILGTLLAPDSGSYLFEGEDVAGGDAVDADALARLRNRRIGFVFQDHRLLPQFTALENVLLPTLAFADRPTDEQVARARQLLDLTGITHIAGQYPGTLSGGEAGRVAVCRALVMSPSLVLADEPTGQLDGRAARELVALLAAVNHDLGTTVVMVTHSEAAAAAAGRRLDLIDGLLK